MILELTLVFNVLRELTIEQALIGANKKRDKKTNYHCKTRKTLLIYRTQISYQPIRRRVYSSDILRYQVMITDLTWPLFLLFILLFSRPILLNLTRGACASSVAYQAGLVWPWVFWLNLVSPNYEPWLDQTGLICH